MSLSLAQISPSLLHLYYFIVLYVLWRQLEKIKCLPRERINKGGRNAKQICDIELIELHMHMLSKHPSGEYLSYNIQILKIDQKLILLI